MDEVTRTVWETRRKIGMTMWDVRQKIEGSGLMKDVGGFFANDDYMDWWPQALP